MGTFPIQQVQNLEMGSGISTPVDPDTAAYYNSMEEDFQLMLEKNLSLEAMVEVCMYACIYVSMYQSIYASKYL